MSSLAVLHASQLITLAGPPRARSGKELGDLGIIPNGGLLAAEGKISCVGSTAEIGKLCQSDTEVFDARGCVVLPGFVHTAMTDSVKGPKPGLMSAERAALLIRRGLERNRARIAFPRWLACSLLLLSVLPRPLAERIMRAFGFG